MQAERGEELEPNPETLSADERARVFASTRLSSTLTWGLLVVVAGLLGLSYFVLDHVFDELPHAFTQRLLHDVAALRRASMLVLSVGAFAVLACGVLFVRLYIAPRLRAGEQALLRMERLAEQAREGARLKSQFLANMSHEIRTPMNGVLGMTRLILGQSLEPKLRRYVETIDASGRALLTIINDILDLSKIEAGKYKIQSLDFDPITVTQEVAELLSDAAHGKSIDLAYRIAPDVPARAKGDPDRYRQILTNLVGNAVKFTAVGEVSVQVSVESADESTVVLRVLVSDTGIGIPHAAQGHVFEAFSQQDGALGRAQSGTGLGLSISKRLVEMMGGSIDFTSEEGVGSKFWFTLPLGRVTSAYAAESRRVEPEDRRVLVIDASTTWREVIAEQVTSWGMRCVTEASGDAGLSLLRDSVMIGQAFDVVLLALHTRDLGGLELAARIAREPALSSTKIVFMTQGGSVPSELPHSVAFHVAKPLRASDLYDCLVGALRGDTQQRERKRRDSDEASVRKRGTRVLVVEDNEVNQFVAIEQVKRLGYEVELARNGLEAVEAVQRGGFHAVLMDCQMPVMDGYEATREIRRREGSGARLPIIALTAHALMGEREKVLDVGMDDYLTKPLRADALRKLLAHFVDARLSDEASPQEPAAPLAAEPASGTARDLDPETPRSQKVIELVLRLVPGQLAVLGEALDAGELEQMRAHAHKLKGSAASIGAQRMALVAEQLQHLQSGGVDEARALFEQLRERFEIVRGLLDAELGRSKGTRGVA